VLKGLGVQKCAERGCCLFPVALECYLIMEMEGLKLQQPSWWALFLSECLCRIAIGAGSCSNTKVMDLISQTIEMKYGNALYNR